MKCLLKTAMAKEKDQNESERPQKDPRTRWDLSRDLKIGLDRWRMSLGVFQAGWYIGQLHGCAHAWCV